MPTNLTVGDVMTTEVLSFTADEPVSAAMQKLVDRDVDGGPVVGADGEVVGMLSTSDLIVRESKLHFPTVLTLLGATIEWPSEKKKFDEDLEKKLGASVAEVMDDDPVVIGEHETIEAAATKMHDKDVSRLPVVRDGVLVGIVARADVLRAIVQSAGEDG
jgi:CBS domain-containing protein